jgi:hypothetical protein
VTDAAFRAARRAAAPGSAAHVYDGVFRPEPAQLVSQTGVALPAQDHARSAEKPGQPGEARVMGVVVGCTSLLHLHSQTLTVEPRFKSSGDVPELLSIGEVAQRAHVPTSTVRSTSDAASLPLTGDSQDSAATAPRRSAGSYSSACCRTPA